MKHFALNATTAERSADSEQSALYKEAMMMEKITITIGDVNNELLLTCFDNYTNFKVVPFSSPDISSYNSDYERLYNKYSAVIKNMDENMPVVGLSS